MSFAPCLDILPQAQRGLWPGLAPLQARGLVLYGGTALALRLGHRVSVDFDFFAARPLDKPGLRELPLLAGSRPLQDEPETLVVLTPAGVKLAFYGVGFGRLGTPEQTADGVLAAASLEDLLACKLKCLFDRAESKDYADIAALLRHGLDLARGLAGAALLFGPGFQPMTALKALTFYEDGDLAGLPQADRETLALAAAAVRHLPPAVLAGTAPGAGGPA